MCDLYIRHVFRKMDDEDEIIVAMYCSRGVQFRCRNDSVQVEETETLHNPHGLNSISETDTDMMRIALCFQK